MVEEKYGTRDTSNQTITHRPRIITPDLDKIETDLNNTAPQNDWGVSVDAGRKVWLGPSRLLEFPTVERLKHRGGCWWTPERGWGGPANHPPPPTMPDSYPRILTLLQS